MDMGGLRAVGDSGKAVTGQSGSDGAGLWRTCEGCGRLFLARRRDQWAHAGKCSDKAYNRRHPVVRVEQPRLDFTPAAHGLAVEGRRRESKARAIVALLAERPATTWDLARVGGIRFSARLQELEAEGLRYEREDRGDHSVYTLTQAPDWWTA